MRSDLLTTNLGTIIVIDGQTAKGQRWLRRSVQGRQPSVQCDHRCGIDILYGALDAGLTLEDSRTGRKTKGGIA